MAKQRYINTRFWSDNYIATLDPLERYMFLYFLTNEHTNIAGIYELPFRTLVFEVSLPQKKVEQILERFQKDKKIFYSDGWVMIKNFANHQKNNPSVREGIKKALDEIPVEIMAKLKQKETDTPQPETEGVQPGTSVSESKPVSESKLEPKPNSEHGSQEIARIIEIFRELSPALDYGNKTQRKAAQSILAHCKTPERAFTACKLIVTLQGKPYAPRASTPYVAWQKWGDFKSYLEAEQSKSTKVAKI